jgi:hypothetical protein
MTTHTLRITIGEGEMTYGKARIHCPDNGGTTCAIPVEANHCPEVAHDRDFHISHRVAEGDSTAEAEAEWAEDAEHLTTTCDVGWWWDGDHCHPGPVGSGCNYAEFVDHSGQECLNLTAEMKFDVPVRLGHLVYEDVLDVTRLALDIRGMGVTP